MLCRGIVHRPVTKQVNVYMCVSVSEKMKVNKERSAWVIGKTLAPVYAVFVYCMCMCEATGCHGMCPLSLPLLICGWVSYYSPIAMIKHHYQDNLQMEV